MKLRQVILLEIIVLIVIGLVGVSLPAHRSAHALPGSPHNLDKVYQEFNTEYFQDSLPKNVIVDFSETDGNMATTNKLADGKFRISFNKKYITAQRIAREIMLHEQCHIKAWGNLTEEDWETESHGKKWRTCMLNLDIEGAFRRELIDYYQGY